MAFSLSELEEETLRNLGYCDIGEGRVSRIEAGGALRMLMRNRANVEKQTGKHLYYFERHSKNGGKTEIVEDAARKYAGNPIWIGTDLALTFPASEHRVTNAIFVPAESHRVISEIKSRSLASPDRPDTSTIEAAQKAACDKEIMESIAEELRAKKQLAEAMEAEIKERTRENARRNRAEKLKKKQEEERMATYIAEALF